MYEGDMTVAYSHRGLPEVSFGMSFMGSFGNKSSACFFLSFFGFENTTT